jgi:hypothetical protein
MPFEPTAILMGTDASQRKVVPGRFSLERKAGSPFKENIYFSAAPLQTAAHLELLQSIETTLA